MIRDVERLSTPFEFDSVDECNENDPTPAEIATRAAMIRARWSSHQRESRRVTSTNFVITQKISVEEWAASIASARSS